jgi:CheY-like chemotaxis protein
LIERTVAICRRAFDRSIELSSHCPDEPLVAVADATQLEHALLNLLINARDAVTEPEVTTRRVRVEVERVTAQGPAMSAIGLEGGHAYVRIRVIDSGVGMDAATQSRIYEPFFTTKEVGKGTGLGLSTTRTTVEEHGGVLECSSTKGVGTTFSAYLPLATTIDPRAAATVDADEKRGTETILVVDDEAPVREVVRAMLESAGYTVLVAPGGREALELLASEDVRRRVALVLLDLTMPGMSGDTTRRHLRELAPNLKIAYFSGHALEASDDVAGVFAKPIGHAALVRGVRELLDLNGTAAEGAR